ncbi:MAG: AAA family ATPase [Clostridiales bacterium]|jgi:SpoVK/Ycf46/Vps4 family AAA+-type ATPase|nr:AAA family ATPase [Clostridiales bacterium]
MSQPGWFRDFTGKYKAGISHTFLFNFNVRDYVDSKREMERYIHDEFLSSRKFAIVASYDIARGLVFPDAGMEREFRKIALASSGASLPPSMPPSKIFPLIDAALRSTKMALFVNHAEVLVPSGGTAGMTGEERLALVWLCEWSVSAKISAGGSLICLTSGNIAAAAPELLSSSYKIEPVLVGLPDEGERLSYIRDHLAQKPVALSIPEREFAALSSGLSKKNIRDIMLRAEAGGVPVSFDFIKEMKHSVLQKEYSDVLEFIYPEIGFEDIGGMGAAKRYLSRNIIEPIKKNDLRRVPMGVLLCGPSGTGKTLLAYALARASGFNCVKIDMARILGQYVGESEKNFKKCLLGAQSQQPVIVFVDEIDTAFRRGDERDSGVSRNIFSEFLQFTGNTSNRGKVIFIAATNRPDLLDPALKRAGRFDKKIPILMPSQHERADVFKVLLKKYGFKSDIDDFAPFAEGTPGYTGAEIESVLRKAYELACDDGLDGGDGRPDGNSEAGEAPGGAATGSAGAGGEAPNGRDGRPNGGGESDAGGDGQPNACGNGRLDGAGACQTEAGGEAPDGAGNADGGKEPAGASTGAGSAGEAVIRARHLRSAIEKCRANTGQVEMMTKLAIDECDDTDLLEQR